MADTYDVVTLAEAKTAVGVKGTAQNTRLELYITAASRKFDEEFGAVVRRTVTGEQHDGGGKLVVLRHPVTAFTSVTEYDGTTGTVLTSETPGVEPADGYKADKDDRDPNLYTGLLWRRTSGCDAEWARGRGNVVVTYTAGRYADTASVDARFKVAMFAMLKNLWVMEESTVDDDDLDTPGGSFPEFAIPKAVLVMLADDRRRVLGIG